MTARMQGGSSASYRGKQSDDDFQRHNANRHHREQSGQDRFRQEVLQKDAGRVIYSIEAETRTADGELYYRLRCEGEGGPRDGQWVNAKEVMRKGNYVLA